MRRALATATAKSCACRDFTYPGLMLFEFSKVKTTMDDDATEERDAFGMDVSAYLNVLSLCAHQADETPICSARPVLATLGRLDTSFVEYSTIFYRVFDKIIDEPHRGANTGNIFSTIALRHPPKRKDGSWASPSTSATL